MDPKKKKQELHIKTFKVPIERVEGKVVVKMVELTDDMLVKTEKIELKSPFLEIPEKSKKVAQYNKRQVVFAENDLDRDYINKKIITK